MGQYEDNSNFSFLGTKNALNGFPVAEKNQSFIATFKGVVSSEPEVINQSSFFITYIVDEEGRVSKVSEDSDAQRNLRQNFDNGSQVVVRIDQGTLLNPQLAGEHIVTGVGSFIPILLTQTGSLSSAHINTIDFLNFNQQVNTDVPNYLGGAFLSESLSYSFIHPNSVILSQYGPPLSITNGENYFTPSTFLTASSPDNDAASWEDSGDVPEDNGSNGTYKFPSDLGVLTFSTLNYRVATTLLNFNQNQVSVGISLLRRRGATLTVLNSQTFNLPGYVAINNVNYIVPSENSINFSYTVNINEIQANDELFIRIGASQIKDIAAEGQTLNNIAGIFSNTGMGNVFIKKSTKNYPDGTTVEVPDFTFDAVNQNPTTLDQGVYYDNQTPYFESGSNSGPSVLTSSLYLSLNYGNVQLTPTGSEDFGFSPINSELTIVPGDKIRFGFNSDEIYTIYNVVEPTSVGDPIFLTLDRQLSTNLNLNNFVLYRTLSDGKFITLDVPKNDPQSSEVEFTGLIIPRFVTQKLRDNAESIVLQLKQDGIIED